MHRVTLNDILSNFPRRSKAWLLIKKVRVFLYGNTTKNFENYLLRLLKTRLQQV